MIETRHPRQPGIVYGVFESPQDELQAYAIETRNETPGVIAVSSYCIVSFGLFFRAALAQRDVLVDVGNPEQESSREEMGPGPHVFERPRDRERLVMARLLTMMAMRFLTAHEMTHILNGHLRCALNSNTGSKIGEARATLSAEDALIRQTMEMDADAGAVVDCMPGVIFSERKPDEADRIGCHPVYKKADAALRLWLFAMYSVCRVLEDDSTSLPIDQASHPTPMMRIQMIMGTLEEFLNREKLERLQAMIPGLIERTLVEGETAYAAVSGRSLDFGPMSFALSDSAQSRIYSIIRQWGEVRPMLERFARYPERLAPLP